MPPALAESGSGHSVREAQRFASGAARQLTGKISCPLAIWIHARILFFVMDVQRGASPISMRRSGIRIGSVIVFRGAGKVYHRAGARTVGRGLPKRRRRTPGMRNNRAGAACRAGNRMENKDSAANPYGNGGRNSGGREKLFRKRLFSRPQPRIRLKTPQKGGCRTAEKIPKCGSPLYMVMVRAV